MPYLHTVEVSWQGNDLTHQKLCCFICNLCSPTSWWLWKPEQSSVNDLCRSPSMKTLIPVLFCKTFRSLGCTVVKKVSLLFCWSLTQDYTSYFRQSCRKPHNDLFWNHLHAGHINVCPWGSHTFWRGEFKWCVKNLWSSKCCSSYSLFGQWGYQQNGFPLHLEELSCIFLFWQKLFLNFRNFESLSTARWTETIVPQTGFDSNTVWSILSLVICLCLLHCTGTSVWVTAW